MSPSSDSSDATCPVARTPEEKAALNAWMLAGRALTTALDRALGDRIHLSLIDHELLTELQSSHERRRMCDLGKSVALTRSGATRAITRLEKAGLVRRLPSPTDGRSTVVELTPAGEEQQRAASEVFRNVIDEHFFAILAPSDLEVLARTSDLIRRSVMGAPICRSELAD